MNRFQVVLDEAMALERIAPLSRMFVLSPFVWAEDRVYRLLVRGVPRRVNPADKISGIYYGSGSNGLHFAMDDEAVLAAGRGADSGGCEDPTVVRYRGGYVVYYSGWDADAQVANLLEARGHSMHGLVKKGGALPDDGRYTSCKEASLWECADGSWRMFFEYASDGRSRIGIARARSAVGPWSYAPPFLEPRDGRWDDTHLSTGPMVAGAEGPLMFYNGANRDGTWRVGWVQFDAKVTCVVSRCDQPLFSIPPPSGGLRDVAFAASALERDGEVWLYYSVSDAYVRRAVLARA